MEEDGPLHRMQKKGGPLHQVEEEEDWFYNRMVEKDGPHHLILVREHVAHELALHGVLHELVPKMISQDFKRRLFLS